MKADGQKQTSKPKIEPVQQQKAVQESPMTTAFAAKSLATGVRVDPLELIGLQRRLGNHKVASMIEQHQQGPWIQRDIERDREAAREAFQQSLEAIESGDVRAAERLLDRAIMNFPDSHVQFYNMARVQLTLGMFGAARLYVNRGQGLPSAPRDQFEGLLNEIVAAEEADVATGDDPGEGQEAGRGWYDQAVASMREGRFGEALDVLDNALRSGGARFSVLFQMATCHLNLGHFGQAETFLNEAAALPGADRTAVNALRRRLEATHPNRREWWQRQHR